MTETMTARNEQAYRIQDVGPSRDLEIRLRPGVNRLRGRNGAGKTEAIKAILRANGQRDVRLTVRDGQERGSVSGPGVLLVVGRKVTSTGEPAVELADYGSLARVIDPGLKGDAPRARARVEALLDLIDLRLGPADVLRLADDDETVAAAAEGALRRQGGEVPILDALSAIRNMAHALAREAEKDADTAKGRLDAVAARLAEIDPDGILTLEDFPRGEAEVIAEQLDEALRTETRLLDKRSQAAELEGRQEAIRASLGERPNDELATQVADAAAAKVADLRAKLALAEQEHRAAVARQEEVHEAARRWDAQKAVLDQPLDKPTDAEISAAVEKVRTLRAEREAAIERDAWKSAKADEVLRCDELDMTVAEGARLRKLADGLPRRVRELLSERGLPGLEIDEDALAYAGPETEGIVVPFDRLSLGQRVRVALRMALRSGACAGRTLPLDPAFWLGLDPEAATELDAISVEMDVFLVTEEPSEDDEITVAHGVAMTDTKLDALARQAAAAGLSTEQWDAILADHPDPIPAAAETALLEAIAAVAKQAQKKR